MKYVVYKIAGEKPQITEIATVKATNSESARMKAIIGTKIEYDNVRAYAYKGDSNGQLEKSN